MTTEQLMALEWMGSLAASHIAYLNDCGEELKADIAREQHSVLLDIIEEGKRAHFFFDDSKKNFIAFMREYAITIPIKEIDGWRMTEPLLGEVRGIPASRGVIHATNGILCYIVRADSSLFLGHFQHFEIDKEAMWDAEDEAQESTARANALARKLANEKRAEAKVSREAWAALQATRKGHKPVNVPRDIAKIRAIPQPKKAPVFVEMD